MKFILHLGLFRMSLWISKTTFVSWRKSCRNLLCICSSQCMYKLFIYFLVSLSTVSPCCVFTTQIVSAGFESNWRRCRAHKPFILLMSSKNHKKSHSSSSPATLTYCFGFQHCDCFMFGTFCGCLGRSLQLLAVGFQNRHFKFYLIDFLQIVLPMTFLRADHWVSEDRATPCLVYV